jgi:hypothetical protein
MHRLSVKNSQGNLTSSFLNFIHIYFTLTPGLLDNHHSWDHAQFSLYIGKSVLTPGRGLAAKRTSKFESAIVIGNPFIEVDTLTFTVFSIPHGQLCGQIATPLKSDSIGGLCEVLSVPHKPP